MENYIEITVKNRLSNYMLEKIDYEHEEFYYMPVRNVKEYKKIKMSFPSKCYGIKITPNEGYATLLIDSLTGFSGENLIEVENSRYLEEFRRRDVGFYAHVKLKHFIIFSSEDILEILTEIPPTFEILG